MHVHYCVLGLVFPGALFRRFTAAMIDPANQSIQRMRASRLAQSQSERRWRLARTADGGR